MARVSDVAAYIRNLRGRVPRWKLHLLVYYSQAWHMVWEDELLFRASIEAWACGPVCPRLDVVEGGQSSRLTDTQRETVRKVVEYYADRPKQWLTDLVMRETPWRETRERAKVLPGESCTEEILQGYMAEYYGSLI